MENDTNICQHHSDRKHLKLRVPGTAIQTRVNKSRQGNSKTNPDRLDSIRQAPRHIRVSIHLREETSLQLM